MVLFLKSGMENRGVSTGKSKLYKCSHSPCLHTGGRRGGETQGGVAQKLCSVSAPASFPKRQSPPGASWNWDAQVEFSLHWAGEEERDEVGAQGCPSSARAAPRRCRPPLSRQPWPARSRKQEEGGRPVRRNNGAGQSRH